MSRSLFVHSLVSTALLASACSSGEALDPAPPALSAVPFAPHSAMGITVKAQSVDTDLYGPPRPAEGNPPGSHPRVLHPYDPPPPTLDTYPLITPPSPFGPPGGVPSPSGSPRPPRSATTQGTPL